MDATPREAAPPDPTAADPPPSGTPVDLAAAVREQEHLRARVDVSVPGPDLSGGDLVAGLDVAYDDEADLAAGAVVVLDALTLEPVEQAVAVGPVTFPYVPGLLAFREVPVLLRALERLRHAPDLLVCDGHGVAHPRGLGLACHLGVLTGRPAVGVAKSPLHPADAPGPQRGASAPILLADREVGRALRTRTGVKPVYVSPGHLIDLDGACRATLHLASRYRLPETTRRADAACRRALAEALVGR